MKTLLVINFSMDSGNALLSHQSSVVKSLAKNFDRVFVITGEAGAQRDFENVQIYSTQWRPGHKVRNIVNFYRIFFSIIFRFRISVVFSHMTDVQSAMTAPFTRILRVRHVLWYAHTHKSPFLEFASYFVNTIVTSTSGSCPLQIDKVHTIGQGVDTQLFQFSRRSKSDTPRCVHVGRFDPSKKIEVIINAIDELRDRGMALNLTLVGSSSSASSAIYSEKITEKVKMSGMSSWIDFYPSIKRQELPEFLHDFDIFVHAYTGSLDKSIIEATLLGLPVATENQEYIKIFGAWASEGEVDLRKELDALIRIEPQKLYLELRRRRKIAEVEHSLTNWINKLNCELI